MPQTPKKSKLDAVPAELLIAQLWDDAPQAQRLLMLALAAEPTRSVYAASYHARHELPSNPTLQTALAALTRKELVGRSNDAEYRVIEPFLAGKTMSANQIELRSSGLASAQKP